MTLSWEVRQDGVRPMGFEDNPSPTLEARSGERVVRGTAAAYSEQGWKGFRGTIVLPASGDWQVPSIEPPTGGGMQMPNLALREKEIQPLVAFLTAERRAASR